MLNDSIRYQHGELYCDHVPVRAIIEQVGTPVYVYSLKRACSNLEQIKTAFSALKPHIHYSAKANRNRALLQAFVRTGAGIDCVSAGEIFHALRAGCPPERIVFAGVGKTPDELRYAVEQGVGWINVENIDECRQLETLAADAGRAVQIALRLNPGVSASTHRHIATGHGAAKFGLEETAVRHLLEHQHEYPHLRFAGIHVHIGSQLHDTAATEQAVRAAIALIAPFPTIRTINIGGGLPVAYSPHEALPDVRAFARALEPLLAEYKVILEPGRSISADAGLLAARVLYIKEQGGHKFVILDGGMTELIRPALYEAHHEIVPLVEPIGSSQYETVEVVGPVCETTDTLAHARPLPPLAPGDAVALLTAGAYGFVMASTYNARPLPPEVVVDETGLSWHIATPRQTFVGYRTTLG